MEADLFEPDILVRRYFVFYCDNDYLQRKKIFRLVLFFHNETLCRFQRRGTLLSINLAEK